MDRIIEVSLRLLEASKMLKNSADNYDLAEVEKIQSRRADLIKELEKLTSEECPFELKAECNQLIKRSQALEDDVRKMLEAKRDEVGLDHRRLVNAKKAKKAYGGS